MKGRDGKKGEAKKKEMGGDTIPQQQFRRLNPELRALTVATKLTT